MGGNQNTPGPADSEGFRLTQVTSGCDHGLALTSDGRVLTWGANDKGQLGQGVTSDPQGRPSVALIPATIKSIRSGCSFSMALDTAGHVWAWA